MLTLVEVTNASGNPLMLSLLDSSNGYVVEDVEGLDPVTATLTSSTMAQMDGAEPQNAQRGTRNITMKVGIEPDWVVDTVDSLRTNLYDWFMTKMNVSMSFFKDGTLFATTTGQVESCTNTMFSPDPEVDISIICYDPDFYAPAPETLSGNTTTGFDTVDIAYEGNSDAGIIFTLNINRNISGFTLYNTTPSGILQKIDMEGTFLTDDIVTITTIPGSKSIMLTRADVTVSFLPFAVEPISWIALQDGGNSFRVSAAGDPIPYTVTYTAKYGAI